MAKKLCSYPNPIDRGETRFHYYIEVPDEPKWGWLFLAIVLPILFVALVIGLIFF